jgi:alkylation response protein AidB-like acyl-CoA dehydrogenase
LVTLAIMEEDGLYGPEGVALRATRDGDAFRLAGVKLLVPYVKSADRLIVAARTSGVSSEAGVSLFLVSPNAAGVAIEPIRNIGAYPLYAVTFDGAVGEPLGPVDGAWDTLNEVLLQAAILQSAMVVGAGERVLEMSVTYAKERVQFGQPIGKHQAVQYLCTEIAIQRRLTHALALHAAWRASAGEPFEREASLAKAQASKAAAAMTFAAHEVHAGIGFINDYNLQLYTLRCKHWEYGLGDRNYHLDLVARRTERVDFS